MSLPDPIPAEGITTAAEQARLLTRLLAFSTLVATDARDLGTPVPDPERLAIGFIMYVLGPEAGGEFLNGYVANYEHPDITIITNHDRKANS